MAVLIDGRSYTIKQIKAVARATVATRDPNNSASGVSLATATLGFIRVVEMMSETTQDMMLRIMMLTTMTTTNGDDDDDDKDGEGDDDDDDGR